MYLNLKTNKRNDFKFSFHSLSLIFIFSFIMIFYDFIFYFILCVFFMGVLLFNYIIYNLNTNTWYIIILCIYVMQVLFFSILHSRTHWVYCTKFIYFLKIKSYPTNGSLFYNKKYWCTSPILVSCFDFCLNEKLPELNM